jgi:hypothetical protein
VPGVDMVRVRVSMWLRKWVRKRLIDGFVGLMGEMRVLI